MRCCTAGLALFLALSAGAVADAAVPASDRIVFDTPEAAVDAFVAACENNSTDEIIAIFGPLAAEHTAQLDPSEERANRQNIANLAKQLRRIEERSDTVRVLLLGYELWPFPMPIVSDGSGWRFDTEAGYDELLKRRVGRNELTAIDVCRTYVEAQYEYSQWDRDNDGILEFAQKVISTPGMQDGLYWPADIDAGEIPSPLGPLLADADASAEQTRTRGFMGYRYRILTSQGKHAFGGRMSYLQKVDMTDGFALIAWPVRYGESGVMTFMVNHHGAVYEKDLGADTTDVAARIKRFDPDFTWQLVKSDG